MKTKKGGDLICKRPESLIEARFCLTKRQNDVLDMVLASIEDDDKLEYQIDIAKYSQLYTIKNKSNVYRDLKKAVKTFENKGFSLTTKNLNDKEHRIYFAWFASIEYIDGESKIVLELGKRLKEIMLNTKKACFYQIKYPLNFNNIYSKRIYYYLKSFENSNKNGEGWRVDKLDDLREKLECPKSYDVYYEFKRFVLSPAQNEINTKSDISFEYEEIKTLKKVTSIKFFINSNRSLQAQSPISLVPDNEVLIITGPEKDDPLEKIIVMMDKHNITKLEARKIYDSSNRDLDIISKIYKDKKDKQVTDIVGLMISLVKPGVYRKPNKDYCGGTFNNYEQRTYNYDELEKMLLA